MTYHWGNIALEKLSYCRTIMWIDHDIHPSRLISIDSVEINPSLLMMRKCEIHLKHDVETKVKANLIIFHFRWNHIYYLWSENTSTNPRAETDGKTEGLDM